MEKLEFKIDGPSFKEGVPIHLAVSALDNFQGIIDKSYLVATGSKKISPKEREKYYLKASQFKEGSLITYFEIALAGVQIGLPLVSDFGPHNLWEYTKDTFNFLKLVCGSVQKGEKPTYQFNNDGNVTVKTGDEIHHYHAPVFNIAQLSLPTYQDLAHLIEPGKLTEISAGKENSSAHDIYIGEEDKKIFDIPTRIEKETIKITCEIYDFNKYKNSGKLSIKTDDQEIPKGQYNFTIFGRQDNVDYIYSMLKPVVDLHCLVEMLDNPFGEDTVHKLHITGVTP